MNKRFGLWCKTSWNGVIVDSGGNPLPNEEQFIVKKNHRFLSELRGLHLRKSYDTGVFHVVGHDSYGKKILDSKELREFSEKTGGRMSLEDPGKHK